MSHQPTIAVDFDGTLCAWAFPACGKPDEAVRDLLVTLKEEGWLIIIYTCRINREWPEPERSYRLAEMTRFLLDNKIPFDSIWASLNGNHGKPVADVYLDDRAINPRTCPDLLAEVEYIAGITKEQLLSGGILKEEIPNA